MTGGTGGPRAYLLKGSTGMLERFPAELRTEICALSFHIRRVEDDKRRPYVAIGHDTERQYEAERRLADPGEPRWYSAYWLLDGFEMLGNCPEDPAGGALYVEEVRRLGLWFDGGAEDAELDAKHDLLGLHIADA